MFQLEKYCYELNYEIAKYGHIVKLLMWYGYMTSKIKYTIFYIDTWLRKAII